MLTFRYHVSTNRTFSHFMQGHSLEILRGIFMKIKSNLRTFFQVQIQHLCSSLQVVMVFSVLTCIQIDVYIKNLKQQATKKSTRWLITPSLLSINSVKIFPLRFMINCTNRWIHPFRLNWYTTKKQQVDTPNILKFIYFRNSIITAIYLSKINKF